MISKIDFHNREEFIFNKPKSIKKEYSTYFKLIYRPTLEKSEIINEQTDTTIDKKVKI